MGKRGPQPTPTEKLLARNSWRGKEAKRKNEIKVPSIKDVPEPPSWLTIGGKEQFERLAPGIQASGLLSAADIDALAAYAERLSQYIELRDAASKENPTLLSVVTLDDGTMVADGLQRANPLHKLRDEAARDCDRLRRELGMSPASRVGLVVEKPKAKIGEIIDRKAGFAT